MSGAQEPKGPLGFSQIRFETYSLREYNQDEQGARSLTVFELTRYELSWALRSKLDWQPKAANPHICRKWCQEALEQAAAAAMASEDSPELRLTEKMIEYILVELDGYTKIADNERGTEVATTSHLKTYTNWADTEQVTKARRSCLAQSVPALCLPFKLADTSKPGYRKILAFFLVDPTKDLVVSDGCTAPAIGMGNYRVRGREIWDLVKDHFTATLMSVDEAAAYGLRLMKVQETHGFGGEQYIRRDFECSRTTRLNAACHCHFGRTNIQSLSAIISSRPQRIKTPSSQFVGRRLGGGFFFRPLTPEKDYTIVVKLSNFSRAIYVVNVQISDIHFRVRCRNPWIVATTGGVRSGPSPKRTFRSKGSISSWETIRRSAAAGNTGLGQVSAWRESQSRGKQVVQNEIRELDGFTCAESETRSDDGKIKGSWRHRLSDPSNPRDKLRPLILKREEPVLSDTTCSAQSRDGNSTDLPASSPSREISRALCMRSIAAATIYAEAMRS
ncbi:hypothetical protein B0H14DRAFT_2555339 [Mycena olivaceomarginata]|nr:hypothetical protein B0H14DRAFT_2555339 [Mycena olivaceomarginata]